MHKKFKVTIPETGVGQEWRRDTAVCRHLSADSEFFILGQTSMQGCSCPAWANRVAPPPCCTRGSGSFYPCEAVRPEAGPILDLLSIRTNWDNWGICENTNSPPPAQNS